MAMAGQIIDVDYSRRGRKRVRVKFTFTANYPGAGGETINFTTLTVAPGVGPGAHIDGVPSNWTVDDDIAGYAAEVNPAGSPTLANFGKLMVYSAAGTELAAGAYPAAITGDEAFVTFIGPRTRM